MCVCEFIYFLTVPARRKVSQSSSCYTKLNFPEHLGGGSPLLNMTMQEWLQYELEAERKCVLKQLPFICYFFCMIPSAPSL